MRHACQAKKDLENRPDALPRPPRVLARLPGRYAHLDRSKAFAAAITVMAIAKL